MLRDLKLLTLKFPLLWRASEREVIVEKPLMKEGYKKPVRKVNCVADQ